MILVGHLETFKLSTVFPCPHDLVAVKLANLFFKLFLKPFQMSSGHGFTWRFYKNERLVVDIQLSLELVFFGGLQPINYLVGANMKRRSLVILLPRPSYSRMDSSR